MPFMTTRHAGGPCPALRSRCLVLLAACAPVWGQSASPSGVGALAEGCAEGELDATFSGLCRDVIREDVLEHPAGSLLPPDFFEWLDEHPRLRDDAYLASAEVGPKVASNLQLLRGLHAKEVEKYAPLAVAYAAAWSGGEDLEPRRFWVDAWLTRGRAVPGMAESFLYHVEERRQMRVSVQRAPWQVLAHLADSLVPIEERRWALDRYRERETEDLRHLFGAVPYTLEPEREHEVYSLESFLEFGGPCTHNVQFAGGVFDAFGIPSGWAGGPGHTYPYWFELRGRELSIHRTNELGNRSGKIRDPLGPGHVWEDDLRLLTLALDHSLAGQRNAALAAWAYRRVPEEARATCAPILVAAVGENPFCAEALAAVAEATELRQLSLEQAGDAWEAIQKGLGAHPLHLLPLLERAVPVAGAETPTFAGDLALLKTLERAWDDAGDLEASSRIPLWQARCLAARGKRDMATRILRGVAEEAAATEPERFVRAVDALAAATPGAPGSEERLDVLRAVLATVEPRPRAGWTELHRSRLHALRLALAELVALDREEEAHRLWFEELAALRGDDPGLGPEPVLVGGSGGESFEDAPAGGELVGLRVTTTGYNGRTVIGSVQGIFRADGAEVVGQRHGQLRAGSPELRAPEGWRVAGLVAAGGDRLDGFQLVYVPRDGSDRRVRMSEWIGSHRERELLIGGRGVVITGIRGRAGADVDALGLVGSAR